MPKLRPVPISTKDKPWWKRWWVWVESTRQWEVIEDWTFVWKGVVLLIKAGFIFDGASIPRIFWSVLSKTGLLLIPSIFHDHGYQHDFLWQILPDGSIVKFGENAGKGFWDKLFMEIGDFVNGYHFVNAIAWTALKVGGWVAWKGDREDLPSSDKLPPMDQRGETPTSF
jgi:hypothetical protein